MHRNGTGGNNKKETNKGKTWGSYNSLRGGGRKRWGEISDQRTKS